MNSTRKWSVLLPTPSGPKRTSVSLEEKFWNWTKRLAKEKEMSINAYVAEIDESDDGLNLSSAIRLHVLGELEKRIDDNPNKTEG